MLEIHKGDTRVAISPERGAIVTSLVVDGRETLYLDQATFDSPGTNVRGGIPVLFPICGPLPEPQYLLGGQAFTMKQHGFARNLAWVVKSHSQSELSLELTENAQTLIQYPFAFRYQLVFQALESGLRIEQKIENRNESEMPTQFGFHPYFKVEDKQALQFSFPVTTFADNKSDERGPFQGLDFGRTEIDWSFPNPTGSRASFLDADADGRLEVTLDYADSYSQLVFWTLKDSPFICVEPWSSARLSFPDGADVHRILPGKTLESYFQISVRILT